MNIQQRIRSQRLKQTYRNQFGPIQLEDDEMFFLVQDDQILQGKQANTIIIEDNDPRTDVKVQPIEPPAHPKFSKKPIVVQDVQPKVDIESEEEQDNSTINREQPQLKKKQARKQIRFEDEEEIIPQNVTFNKNKDYLSYIKQKVTTHINNKTAVQVEVTYKPREEEPSEPYGEISYKQFQFMKQREQQEARLKEQLQEEKKKYLKEKQLEKLAPHQRREGESIQQYRDRMIALMKKDNKFNRKRQVNGGGKKKKPQLTEENLIQNLMKMCNGEQINPPESEQPTLINYDVLYKTGKILKQAMMKPPEPDYNPIAELYKGKYAAEFVFNGGLDFEDGPYGRKQSRKKVKLPFPKHKLTLNPWEYYGVGPDEYFATKDPHFSFKARYVPVQEYYNEMPRPKPDPKYFQYNVDQLMSKRYNELHDEIQYLTAFVGYQKKHWTPLNHLRNKCPNTVLIYEIHERDRLYSVVLDLKVRSVRQVSSLCMLSHKISNYKRQAPSVIYIKGKEKEEVKQTLSNVEKVEEKIDQEYEDYLSSEEEKRRRKVNKEERELQEEWDPNKDTSTRAIRNKQRREKMEQIQKEQEKRKQDLLEAKIHRKKNKKLDLMQEEINQFQIQNETKQQQQQFLNSESKEQEQEELSMEDLKYKSQLDNLKKWKSARVDTAVDLEASYKQFANTNQHILHEQKIMRKLGDQINQMEIQNNYRNGN